MSSGQPGQQQQQGQQQAGQQEAEQDQEGGAAPADATLVATAQADAAVAQKGGAQAVVDRVAVWVASCEQQVSACCLRSSCAPPHEHAPP